MQLTKHTDYAFRVLVYLASMNEEKTTIRNITDIFGISKTHLMKVVNKLANKGWVKSQRGKNGGISLGVPAEDIALDKIFLLMEKTLAPVNCSAPLCRINSVCKLKSILGDSQKAFINHLAQFTLADLIDQKTIDHLNSDQIIMRKL